MQAPQHCVLAARLAWHGGKALQRRHGLRWCSSSLPSSEFRHNAATNDWVVFASGRSGRPYQFAESVSAPAHPAVVHEPHCPFCVGNETMTGPARLVADEHRHLFRPTADTDAEVVSEPTQWQLRVVDNKYPVVSKHTPPSVVASDTTRVINGHGWHEVVIESPKHTCPISARPVDEIVLLLQAWVQRGRTLAEDPQVHHVTTFKNSGPKAGASIQHPHSQIVTLPIVPVQVQDRIHHTTRMFAKHHHCVFCKMLHDEMEEGSRVVASNDAFVAFVPFAAVSPFQVWILPIGHSPSLLSLQSKHQRSLAEILQSVMARLDAVLDMPDYNAVVHNAPIAAEEWSARAMATGPLRAHDVWVSDAHHWYIDVFPRLAPGGLAGFEFSSTVFSNSSCPDEDAARLRAAL